MAITAVLENLNKVRQTGGHKYMACCPVHHDSSASLSIREDDDGTVLLHCFAGCATVDVVAALGLDFSALFPESGVTGHARKSTKAPFNALDALTAMCHGLLELAIYADQVSRGIALSEAGRQRLALLTNRLFAAHTYVNK